MPRISNWKQGQRTNDYKFFDSRIREMFTTGGTGVNIHLYLGPAAQGGSGTADQPSYVNASAQNIQDLLFLENRDRKYDSSVYNMRGIYQTSDLDFDLTQFGLFLSNDTVFMTFHINDMVDALGRKLMSGDVLELEHRKDFYSLNTDVPAALKRYYVIQDATLASEGFSPTWWPHLWRVKIQPLVDSQEYADILRQIKVSDDSDISMRDALSTVNRLLEINQAVIDQAEADTPYSGYDTTPFYVVPTNPDGSPADPEGQGSLTPIGDPAIDNPDPITPRLDLNHGYLVGDGLAPNGFPVSQGIAFPAAPKLGDFSLRLDYLPNRLFRYDGRRWQKVEDAVRTSYTPGTAGTLRNSFVNNTDTITLSGRVVAQRQSLSSLFKSRPDLAVPAPGTVTGAPGATGPRGPQGFPGVTGATGVLRNWITKTSNYITSNTDRIIANTSAGSFTVFLPAAPAPGDYVQITDGHDFALNNLILNAQGGTIENLTTEISVDVRGITLEVFYSAGTWQITASVGV
jgi:hypothetical protein